MSNKKNLLNENTIRRMMKLASVDSLSDSFISTKYTPINESELEEGKYGDKEEVNEEETVSEEATEVVAEEEKDEAELDIEDEGPMDSDDVEPEPEEDEEEGDDEVTLTDDEAREIIALADKLRAAMGEEDAGDEMDMAMDVDADAGDMAMDMEMDAEMEEEPGMGDNRMEEDLYEAALKGLDIEIVEDKKVQLENLSKEIYKKVVARLLQESKK